jgi:hypothetical protein
MTTCMPAKSKHPSCAPLSLTICATAGRAATTPRLTADTSRPLGIDAYTTTGVIGYPSRATAQKGLKILNYLSRPPNRSLPCSSANRPTRPYRGGYRPPPRNPESRRHEPYGYCSVGFRRRWSVRPRCDTAQKWRTAVLMPPAAIRCTIRSNRRGSLAARVDDGTRCHRERGDQRCVLMARTRRL